MSLRPFTVIGATTRAGMLSAPLRDRFQMREHLEFYTEGELAELVVRNAEKLSVTIDADAADEIARRSRGTPRLANNRLRWVRDFAVSKHNGQVTHAVCCGALEMQEIDVAGLDRQDRKYLETILTIYQGGPVGVEALAHTMNTAIDTLVDDVEPFLLREGLVIRTPRGRRLTAAAYEHLGSTMPSDDESGQGQLF